MVLHAYYVHCASNNLNLVLKGAMEAVTEIVNFTTPLSRYIIFLIIVLCCGKSFRMSTIVHPQILH